MLALKQEVHCLESLSSLSPAGTRVFIMNNRKLSTSISFLVLFLFLHLSITVLLLKRVRYTEYLNEYRQIYIVQFKL